jgi:peptide/nickel transport system substrate-binding protein
VPFNKDCIVVGDLGLAYTVDPASAYDTASQGLIFNVYEPLIFYAVNRSAPRAQAGLVDEFVPYLATAWEISSDGRTYIFKIREGVKFHNDAALTVDDVEYSFERIMVQDMAGGPAWLLYEPLLSCWSANLSDPDWMQKIDNAVETFSNASGSYVQFNLQSAYAPFMNILTQYGFIVNEAFCISHGCWDGQHTMESLLAYHDPSDSPLDYPQHVMCGTGPFELDYLTDNEWSIVRYVNYWQGWPAPSCRGFVERVTTQVPGYPYWPKAKEMFLNGSLDIISVPRQYIAETEALPGIRCTKNLPSMTVNSLLFTFDINTSSTYMGIPGGLLPSTFDETGIPPNFFNDTDLRKGLAYCYNWTRYIEDEMTYSGEATQPATIVIEGLPYRNPAQAKYYLNLTVAETHFINAWNGQVWEKGFTMTIPYVAGSLPRYQWIEAFKHNVESLNPKFHINMVGIPWSIYLSDFGFSKIPIFCFGWVGDYPDPNDFVQPFMHSRGDFSKYQRYGNATIDTLIEEGLQTLNQTRRREIYYELQSIYHDDCPGFPTVQPLGRHWERKWVQGWYYNIGYPGNYFYHLWKQQMGDLGSGAPPQFLQFDGVVDGKDLSLFLQCFKGLAPPEAMYIADLGGGIPPQFYKYDGKVDGKDLALFLQCFKGLGP